jgi:DNA-binding winged helix-turn-helix (wHTH) protein
VIYLFGEFELDAAHFELRLRGKPKEVQPKVLRLILHLVRESARVVSNDELLRVLWPEEVVGPGSIKRAVLGARQALEDSQNRIRTVRGFGYQFVGDLVAREVAEAVAQPRESKPVSLAAHSAARAALLGREGIMALLLERLQQAKSGVSSCVLITGEPGLGKTRILEELLVRAEQHGVEVWFGRCTEVEGAPAFWPFIQIFREALRWRGAERLRALLGSEGADIAGAISELREQLADLPEAAPLSSASSRFRLFDSMAVFLRRAADERPILLVLDDLHRADPASLRLLLFLLRHVQRARILFVGAFRPDSPESAETTALLAALSSESSARRVALHGFGTKEIARYVELATGVEPPASVAELLHAQTAGNPLFMQHLIENWRAATEGESPLGWQSLANMPLTHGLAGAIERHLEFVSPDCRELLCIAAVLGTEFSAGFLSRVAERPAVDCNAHLAEAAAFGLLRELAPEQRHYRFAHVLLRDALYAQLSAAARANLHGRAARAIEAQGIGENAVLLAEVTRHFVSAAPSHDASRALHYTLRAAEAALRTLAYEQAASDFDRALSLLQYQPPDPRQRMTLLFRKGDALARVDLPAARAALFEAAALARELADYEVLVRAATLIAIPPESGTVDNEQVAVLRQALEALRAHDEHDDRCVLLQALIAKSLLYERAPQERVSLARGALCEARTLQASARRAEVLTRCHEALPGPEHLHERLGISAELTRLAGETGDQLAQLRAFGVQIENAVECGDMARVDSALDGMEVLAERMREPLYRWYGKVMRAMRDYVRGDLAGADRRMHDAWQSGAPVSPELVRHVFCVQQNALLRLRGQVAQAQPLVREMMLQFPMLTGWTAAWGALLWDLGQQDDARRCLERLMVHGAAATRSESSVLSSYAALAELSWKVGDITAAKDVYTVMLPYAEHHGLTNMGAGTFGPLNRHLGTLAECLGDVTLAETHYRAALTAATRMPSPVFSSGISWLYARLLLRSGDAGRRGRATELLSSAFQLATDFDLHSIASVCRSLASLHGVSVERGATRERRGVAHETEN